jgi:rRNA-processing protein FCF1
MVENLIILDSNFILLPFQFKIDYLKQIRESLVGDIFFIVYQQIIDELKAKENRFPNKIRFKKNLQAGLTYLDHNKSIYKIIFNGATKKESETTDNFLIRKCISLKSEESRVYLATNDKELRRKANNAKIFSIFMRQKKYIDLEGF